MERNMDKALVKTLKSGKALEVYAEKAKKSDEIYVRVWLTEIDGNRNQLDWPQFGGLNAHPEYKEKGYTASIWLADGSKRFFPLTADEAKQIEDVALRGKVID
jgi:hypothetical protein